ncbi:MAG: ferredoxin--NADP reductase [Terriglobales bacterium]
MDRLLLTARLVRSVALTEQTKHLEFEVEGAKPFNFAAGQFVSIREPHDGHQASGHYSIASAPRGDNRFELCVNRVPDAFFSNYLCDLAEGKPVRLHGPHGRFALRQPVRDSLFVATGTGIAPLRAMLQWLLADKARHWGHQLTLIFGVRYARDLYYDAEFQRMAGGHANFHYVPTLSRDNPGWKGASGYVQEYVRRIAGDRTDVDAYLCGRPDMVAANRDLLRGLGWERKSIHYEKFE